LNENGDVVKVVFSSAPNGEGTFWWVDKMEGQRHTGERGWKGEKHYNKYNVITPACMVEDAVMCAIQVHQMLV